jgi:cytoskeleton protein RodZ
MSIPHINVELLMSDLAQENSEGASFESEQNVLNGSTLGQILSLARLENNWSVEYVADYLKLSHKQVLSIESNDYASLPTMVIVRGFVRSYAKLLKLDADNLVALLPNEGKVLSIDVPLRPKLATPFVESRSNLLGRDEQNHFYKIGILLVAIILVGFFAWYYRVQINLKFNEIFPAVAQDVVVIKELPSELPSSGAVINALEVNEPQRDLTASAPASSSGLNANAASSVALSAPVQKEVEPVPASVSNMAKLNEVIPGQTQSLSDSNFLHLKVNQDAWMQVKTEKGVILFSRLAKSGTEESFPLSVPLMVKIGNVAGVQVSVRGEPLDLKSESGTNVANIVVK